MKILDDILMHYGVGHRDGGNSGRYKWGSGENPYQHSGDFLSRIDELAGQGFTESVSSELIATIPPINVIMKTAILMPIFL